MTPAPRAAPHGAPGQLAGGARTSANAAMVVASSCPRCGAPLDFEEGSNAVRCRHCSCVLLVTGRRSVLSYAIRARVSPSEARTLAGFAATASRRERPGAPCLTYVPYYRMSAEEALWRRERKAPRATPDASDSGDLGDRLARFVAGTRSRGDGGELGRPACDEDGTVVLASRVLERNFLACDLGSAARWSLGVRPAVLRLELFQRDVLERDGVVLAPTMSADVALARALEPPDEGAVLRRDVLRAVLSLVYFPLWTVPTGGGARRRVTVLDGVTGAIVARDADATALDGLAREVATPDRVLGFRALCCPNCGWDLPVRAADVVFHCASCERTWELRGEELERIDCDVLRATPGRDAIEGPLLPVWQVEGMVRVRGGGEAQPRRLHAPAFRWRALKSLADLGAGLTRRVPDAPETEPVKSMALVGCTLDRVDAITMARLVAMRLRALEPAGLASRERPQVEIENARTRLLWLPFAGDAYSVRDPFAGYALPRRLLDELLLADG